MPLLPQRTLAALLVLVASAPLPGCLGPQPPEHYAVGVVLRAVYPGAFDAEAVREAALAAGWSAEAAASPTGLGGLALRPPDGRTLHATPAAENHSASRDAWEVSLQHEFEEPVRQPDATAAGAYARGRGEAMLDEFAALVAPLERAGGFERSRLDASCLCSVVIYD